MSADRVEIRVPTVGESIVEGQLVEWAQPDGAWVQADSPLFELETDKITMTVTSQQAGRLSIAVPAGSRVEIGQVVGWLEPGAEPAVEVEAGARPEGTGAGTRPEAAGAGTRPEAAGAGAQPEAAGAGTRPEAAGAGAQPVGAGAGTQPVGAGAGTQPVGAGAGTQPVGAGAVPRPEGAGLSPAVRRLVEEHGLDPGQIAGTGPHGRLTREDVLRHLEQVAGSPAPPPSLSPGAAAAAARGPEPGSPYAPPPHAPPPHAPPLHAPPPSHAPSPPRAPAAPPPEHAPEPAPPSARSGPAHAAREPAPEHRETRQPLSPLRQRVAERLVQVQQTAAILTTFSEADLGELQAMRQRYRAEFEQRHGVRLGLMSFFIKAVVDALGEVPQLNQRIEGNELVRQHYYDIGVAVGTEQGLVVPVLRDCDRLSFAALERALADAASRARARTLTLDELAGGCFTITNGGIYGSLLSTPILNPPQSGILGMHAIQRRPVAVGDRIEIRPMMYLALSYDHRLVDGREAVTFLRRIVACVEHPERMMLGV